MNETTRLGGVHDVLPDIHFAEALEEGKDGKVKALPRPLPIPLLMQPRIYHLEQAKHASPQVPI